LGRAVSALRIGTFALALVHGAAEAIRLGPSLYDIGAGGVVREMERLVAAVTGKSRVFLDEPLLAN
jgi:hypothetical protein